MIGDTTEEFDDALGDALPTIAEVVAMPATQLGRPKVLAGEVSLGRRVRWLHVSELKDIASMLHGGELILTTGIALPNADDELAAYASQLVSVGASGVILELGQRYASAPAALVRACAKSGLPLIVLGNQVEFVRLTEAVHARILESQMAALRASERVNKVFTSLSVAEASVAEIVDAAGRLAGAPAVFEDLMRHVLAFNAGAVPVEILLNRWEIRSREAQTSDRTAICGQEEWAVTSVEVHGEVLGRLILLPPQRPTVEQLTIIERAATALTLNWLLESDHGSMELQAQRSVLADIIEGRFSQDVDVYARTDSLGIPLRRRVFIGMLIQQARPGAASARQIKALAPIVTSAARAVGVSVLLTSWADGALGALVVVNATSDRTDALTLLAREVRSRCDQPWLSIGVGSTVTRLSEVRRSFSEASQVARAAAAHGDQSRCYHELPDVGIRGLMLTLVGDPRLQTFVARTLDPLLDYDARHGTSLLTALGTFLDCRGNKSEAARKACMSRAAFYERLDTIARILDVDMTSGEVCTTLHAAVMAVEAEYPTALPVTTTR